LFSEGGELRLQMRNLIAKLRDFFCEGFDAVGWRLARWDRIARRSYIFSRDVFNYRTSGRRRIR